jgi:hypothetical protein
VVVLALAELDPSLGGNPNNLLAYSRDGVTFAGGERTILSWDAARGRWQSNLYSVTVTDVGAVPEPSTWAMMILGFAGVGFMTYRRRKTAALAA